MNFKLTMVQSRLLLILYIFDLEGQVDQLVNRNERTRAHSATLLKAGFLRSDPAGVVVSAAGIDYLSTNGLIDRDGVPTELGNREYREGIENLNESFILIGSLVS